MKATLFIGCVLLAIAGTSTASTVRTETTSTARTKTVRIEVTNPWDQAKTDEPIVLRIDSLSPGFTVRSATVVRGDEEIPSQLDDFDGDLRADELAFVIDLPARSQTGLCITLSDEKPTNIYPARVYAQLLFRTSKKGKYVKGVSIAARGDADTYNVLHHHGVAFESELNAWRIYFDEKQTTDLYGKFHKGLEIEESLFYPTEEQLQRGFGDDVIMVKNSCGAGTLKGWDGTAATHIAPVAVRGQRIIATGPVRTIVEAEVKGWQYQDCELNMVNRYTLYAGHRDAQVDVVFDRPLTHEIFATGVQHIGGADASMFSDHEGLVGSWGTDWPVTDTLHYRKETVGLGTFIPRRYVVQETSDPDNYLYTLQAKGQTGFRYWTTFTSRKETFGYPDAAAWYAYLQTWKQCLEQPAKVTVLPTTDAY